MNNSAILAADRTLTFGDAPREPGANAPLGRFPYSPGRLVSLWEMFEFYANDFIRLFEYLARMRGVVENTIRSEADIAANECRVAAFPDSPESLALRAQIVESRQSHAGRAEEIKNLLVELLGGAERFCVNLQIPVTQAQVVRIRSSVKEKGITTETSDALAEFRRRAEDELTSHVFRYVPRERARHFDFTNPPFGDAVRDKLPSLATDIEHASLCLGYGLPTAAVCHLMRVMETGIRAFAKRLGVPRNLVHRKPWGDVLREVDAKVASFPPSARRDKYSDWAAYLRHVKDAWRNTTMHPDRLYDQQEAESIFNAVRDFMVKLAKG